MAEMSAPIEDYALIGDCESAALVGRGGSIDWLCWPRFDSPACFAALLGDEQNGRWRLAPDHDGLQVARGYRDGTLVLETTFAGHGAEAALIDFMPIRDGASDLVRILEGRRGCMRFTSDLAIRFDYGRTVPWVNRGSDGALTAIAGPNLLTLRGSVEHHGQEMRSRAEFAVRAGERIVFTLTRTGSLEPPAQPIDVQHSLVSTEDFWRKFVARCPPVGPWSGPVRRSLVTLKALTYLPSGGMVAAATTSLPEAIGGSRNWDYRYCWLRDATFTLLAFMNLGYFDEAKAWRDWLMRAIAGAPAQLQIMYGLAGERELIEWIAPWLDGYESSRPVRVGNAAAGQLQLDVFGEVLDAIHAGIRGGLDRHPHGLAISQALIEHLETIWREPDEGIWEVRGGRRQFTHSKVLAWTAFDRAAKLMADLDDGQAQRWRGLADTVHREVCERGFSAELGSFVQSYGDRQLDASLLQLPLVGFLPADDPRIMGTVRAIEQRLMHEGLLRRYETADGKDGLPPGEGVFIACSFWLVQVYAQQRRFAEAEALFERLLALGNDVGLISEQYDPVAKRQLGNFPQAFSHVGLINAALALSGNDRQDRARNGQEAKRAISG